MRDLVVTVIVLGLVPMMLKRPYVGVLVWTWLAYMNPHRLAWGFAYEFPFSVVVGVATLLGLVFWSEPKRIPWNPVTVVLLAFDLWMNVTTLFAFAPDQAWTQWERVMKIQLMNWVTIVVMANKDRLKALVWVIVLSIGFFSLKGGLFLLLTGGQYRISGPPDSFIADNNALAVAGIMVLPLMNYLRLQSANKWIRRGIMFAMLLASWAVIGSYSRGGLLGLSVVGLLLWLKSRKKLLIGLLMVAAVLVMLAYMPEKWSARMQTIQTYEEDESAMGRIEAWTFAYNLAKDRPIVGGGFETFVPWLYWDYVKEPKHFQGPHSIYFQVLGEHGFVGLGLFLLLGMAAWRTSARVIRETRGIEELAWARDLVAMVQVSLLGFATGGAFLPLAYFDLYYHLLAIVVLTGSLVTAVASERARLEREAARAPSG